MSERRKCYCCTCVYSDFGVLVQWDPACRNHGAHGLRECKRHGLPLEECDCGCRNVQAASSEKAPTK